MVINLGEMSVEEEEDTVIRSPAIETAGGQYFNTNKFTYAKYAKTNFMSPTDVLIDEDDLGRCCLAGSSKAAVIYTPSKFANEHDFVDFEYKPYIKAVQSKHQRCPSYNSVLINAGNVFSPLKTPCAKLDFNNCLNYSLSKKFVDSLKKLASVENDSEGLANMESACRKLVIDDLDPLESANKNFAEGEVVNESCEFVICDEIENNMNNVVKCYEDDVFVEEGAGALHASRKRLSANNDQSSLFLINATKNLKISVNDKVFSTPEIIPFVVNKKNLIDGKNFKCLTLPSFNDAETNLNTKSVNLTRVNIFDEFDLERDHKFIHNISVEDVRNLLVGDDTQKNVNRLFDGKRIMVIDCRYPYEYMGGHVANAYNVYTMDMLDDFLINNAKELLFEHEKWPILIFHCEFSSKRGPRMARYLRNRDRNIHKSCYPKLYYPEVYVMTGGYKCFYESFPELCEPRAYVTMNDKNHIDELKIYCSRSSYQSESECFSSCKNNNKSKLSFLSFKKRLL